MRFAPYEDRGRIHCETVSGERIHPLRPAPPTESPVSSLIELSGQVTTFAPELLSPGYTPHTGGMKPAEAADDTAMRATLETLARELVKSKDIAAVQILALGDAADEVRVLGMAGFSDSADFPDLLAACRLLGARPLFVEAFTTGRPIVVAHRRAEHLADPAWQPLSEFMGVPDWDGFVAMPLLSHGQALGVINAYFQTGVEPDRDALEYLRAKADQAAIAVDTVSLLARTRSQARVDARRRLARDLYVSLELQLSTLHMRAKAMQGAAAHELTELAGTALADLRALMAELGPVGLDAFNDADSDHLARVVRAAVAGESHTDAAMLLPARGPDDVAPDPAISKLTPRERQILTLIGRGFSNLEIAAELFISERTARTHVSNVLLKLGLASRTQAALLAVREALV